MPATDARSVEAAPSTPSVHSINHFAMAVPDLAAARHFYSSFGLEVREDRDRLTLLTPNHAAAEGLVVDGKQKRLHHLSFGIYESDVVRFRDHLAQCRVRRVDSPRGFESDGLWFRDSEELLVEIRVAAKASPDTKTFPDATSALEGVAGAPRRSQVAQVCPRRLSHVMVFARDVSQQVQFYSRVLGLRLSDRAGDGIAFLHAIHGSDHHILAFAKSGGPGFHHCSWDVPSVHHVGLGAMQMANSGFAAGWGLGRHVAGSNYFYYARDPWGSYAEYSCDIDYIPKGFDWRPQDYAANEPLYVWGPPKPPDFGLNYELTSG